MVTMHRSDQLTIGNLAAVYDGTKTLLKHGWQSVLLWLVEQPV